VLDIRCAARLRHSSEQNVHGLTHPLCVTIEQLIDDDDYVLPRPARLKDEAKGGQAMLQVAHAAEAADEDAGGATVGATLLEHSRTIRLKWETASSEAEEHWAREMTLSRLLKARTEVGLAFGSNSSNSLSASRGRGSPTLLVPR